MQFFTTRKGEYLIAKTCHPPLAGFYKTCQAPLGNLHQALHNVLMMRRKCSI